MIAACEPALYVCWVSGAELKPVLNYDFFASPIFSTHNFSPQQSVSLPRFVFSRTIAMRWCAGFPPGVSSCSENAESSEKQKNFLPGNNCCDQVCMQVQVLVCSCIHALGTSCFCTHHRRVHCHFELDPPLNFIKYCNVSWLILFKQRYSERTVV